MKNLNIKINNKELNLNKKSLTKLIILIVFVTSIALNGVLIYKLNHRNTLLKQYSSLAQKIVTHIETVNTQVKNQAQTIANFEENIRLGKCNK